uniref:Uncharacterized protein n=1 Tax=Cyclophora tenuis TaxID=216820 RepID=A0A6U1QHW2_CYCTE|mmetsp:Transcript_18042/g.30756  ORF Transcript_18042/g.30756 Transcript_18042/m.30756 type:complete len:152 (+) Transcript_18042:560-1015(+)
MPFFTHSRHTYQLDAVRQTWCPLRCACDIFDAMVYMILHRPNTPVKSSSSVNNQSYKSLCEVVCTEREREGGVALYDISFVLLLDSISVTHNQKMSKLSTNALSCHNIQTQPFGRSFRWEGGWGPLFVRTRPRNQSLLMDSENVREFLRSF